MMQGYRREFLFLQGPPGPFFRELAARLAQRGLGIHRINLCGGDRFDWPGDATDFRGRMRDWPMFFDGFARERAVTDLVLFGDCRPMHKVALRLAQLRGIHIHVFEEGYIRPNWLTLERDGVNGHSPMERDADLVLAAARWLPPVPDLPPITADFRRRARDSYWYYHHVVTGKLRFPFHRSHRQGSLIGEGIGWLLKFRRAPRRRRKAEKTLGAIEGCRYFLFPLQLTGDYQIRAHSPFGAMHVAVTYVLESFARIAPPDAVLVTKEHPLDSGFTNWSRFVARAARRLGVANRVHHIDGGDLDTLVKGSAGMVCVNSTSGTLALDARVPVIALGDAVYNIRDVTHQGGLDRFWTHPEAADAPTWDALKRLLHARCLVRGGLASQSAVEILVRNSAERLLADTVRTAAPRRSARQTS